MTEYMVTKEQCESKISGVCPGCGGAVTAIETVDNSHNPTYWSGCLGCSSFTSGYPLETFTIGRTLVEEGTVIPYEMDRGKTEEEQNYWLTRQTMRATHIVMRVQKMLEASHES